MRQAPLDFEGASYCNKVIYGRFRDYLKLRGGTLVDQEEQSLKEAKKERETKRSEKRAAEEIEQLAREQATREAYLATEKAIAEAQEAKKLKAKKQPPE